MNAWTDAHGDRMQSQFVDGEVAGTTRQAECNDKQWLVDGKVDGSARQTLPSSTR